MKSGSLKYDIFGEKFGDLIGLYETGRSKWKDIMWLFKCVCGNNIELVAARVKRGELLHCGCKYVRWNKKHGMCRTKEYNSWCSMIGRCYNKNNPNYFRYGGNGINVCERWKNSFNFFLLDMGFAPSKEHSIDRINNHEGYSPENCRWATQQEQARNRGSNRLIKINGVEKCVTEWCEFYNIKYATYKTRKRRGWNIGEIFSNKRNKNK